MNIPKIIHQIAPKDRERWHPLWHRCQESWLKHFSTFEYKLWDDEEGIDDLVKNSFPQYFDYYVNLPVHIMKIDFARFCILYEYGGIYADMDMFCYKNFYSEIYKEVQILEAPYGDLFLENALMSSSLKNNFFITCIEKSIERYNTHVKNKFNMQFFNSLKDQRIITSACGPDLVCSVFRSYDKNVVGTFSGLTFNNHGMSYDHSFFTKHLMTGLWGKESIDQIKDNSFKPYKETLADLYIEEISNYVDIKFTSIDELNFFTDYTNGGFLREVSLNYEKNDIDNDPNLNNNFVYK